MQLVWVGANEVHESLGLVLGEEDTLLGEDTVVGSLEPLALLQKRDEFGNIAKLLVMLNDVLEMVWMNNNIQTAELCGSEFLGSDASKANSLPDFWNISLLGCIVGLNVLFVHDEDLGKLLVVSQLSEEDLGSLVHLGVKALISYLLKISLIRLSHEVF